MSLAAKSLDLEEGAPPIDEAYVEELLELFRAKALDLVFQVCFGLREGRDLVELADVLQDSVLSIERAVGSLGR